MAGCNGTKRRLPALSCMLLLVLAMQIQDRKVLGDEEQCGGMEGGCRPPSLLPVYEDVEEGSVVAVCVVSKESELPGLKIALLTILQQQPQMKVQLFVFDYVEEALAHAVSRMVTLLAPDGRVEINQLSSNAGASHHEYGMLLKDDNFWMACDGELVLIFQADTMLCRGADIRLEEFSQYDYVGAPFRPGKCPPGHDKDRSMCQDDFDKMALHANLSVPIGGVGGNGGLSLRRRSKMLQLIRACRSAHPFRTWNEDIFFSFPCDDVAVRFPPEHLARKFSVETGLLHARPFGIHKVWAYKSDEELGQVNFRLLVLRLIECMLA